MGTELYTYAERLVDGVWCCACDQQKNPMHNWVEFEAPFELEEVYEVGRNRSLQWVLCGRGHREPYGPIVSPRGLPVDISPEVLAEAESFGTGGFTHSWLLLQELIVFNKLDYKEECWTRVPKQVAAKVRRTGKFKPGDFGVPDDTWEEVNIGNEPFGRAIGLTELIDALTPLGTPEGVRIIYWMDG